MVNLQKLQRLTSKVENTPSKNIDYSQFAQDHFITHIGNVPSMKRPILSLTTSDQDDEAARAVFNEVENYSVDIRVPADEMIDFFERRIAPTRNKRKKPGYDSHLNSPASESDSEMLYPLSNENHKFIDVEFPYNNGIPYNTEEITMVPPTNYNPTDYSKMDEHDSKDLEKNNRSIPKTPDSTSSSQSSPQHVEPLTMSVMPRTHNEPAPPIQPSDLFMTPTSIKRSESSARELIRGNFEMAKLSSTDILRSDGQENPLKNQMRKSSISLTAFFKSQNQLLRSTSSSYLLRRSRSAKLPTTTTASPTQRRCHSVEDTIIADEEFQDFSIPKNQVGYYSNILSYKSNIEKSPSQTGSITRHISTSSTNVFANSNSYTNCLTVGIPSEHEIDVSEEGSSYLNSKFGIKDESPMAEKDTDITEDDILKLYGKL